MSYSISQPNELLAILSLIMSVWLLLTPSTSTTKETLVLKLMWKHASQFAGYYAAQ